MGKARYDDDGRVSLTPPTAQVDIGLGRFVERNVNQAAALASLIPWFAQMHALTSRAPFGPTVDSAGAPAAMRHTNNPGCGRRWCIEALR